MDFKAQLLSKIDPIKAWAILFNGWQPGQNVACVVATENHATGSDTRPSMSLSNEGKAFCHTCGFRATSVIGVLADLKKIGFKEALREAYLLFVGNLVPEAYIKECQQTLLKKYPTLLFEKRGIGNKASLKFELGWDEKRQRLTIPIRNEMGWCINVRLHDTLKKHDPSMKIISYGKGFGTATLWPYWQLTNTGPIYIFEGELDAILAYSYGIPAISVTGGALTWREEWTKQLSGRSIYIVPDQDIAGETGAAKKLASISKVCKTSIILLPELTGEKNDKDFTDWILNHNGSATKLLELTIKAKKVTPTIKDLENDSKAGLDIFKELNSKEKTDINRSNATWAWLKTRGAFFRSQIEQDLYYVREGGATYKVGEKADSFLAMLGSQVSWAINPATSSGKFIIRHLIHRGTIEAKDSLTGSWCLYDGSDSIYIHSGADTLLLAHAGTLQIIKNALNPGGILLECPQQVKAIKPLIESSPQKAIKDAWNTCFNHLPLSQTDKYLVFCWWIGLFLKEYIRPKPLLRFMARTAYGKSTATKMLSLLTYGEEILQNSATTPAALYSIGRQFPILFSDNVETRNMTPAFEDFMLTAATGGGKSKRQINTDQGIVWENINCLVCTNGIEPMNKRELVSRTAEINLDLVKYGTKNFHESNIFKTIKQVRSSIICGVLKLLTSTVIPRIKTGEVQRIAKEFGNHAKNRFDEYFGIMAICLDAIWPDIGDKEYESANAVVATWIRNQNKATDEQDESTNEVLYYLQELADRGASIPDIRTKPRKQTNGSIHLTAYMRTLFTDFKVLARALNSRCPWQNERQLGTRVADASLLIQKLGWTHIVRTINGRRLNEFSKPGTTNNVRELATHKMSGSGMRSLDIHTTNGPTKVSTLCSMLKTDTYIRFEKDWKRVATKGTK